jgi:hypothetical protein
MSINIQGIILQKFKKYRAMWIIGAVPIVVFDVVLVVVACNSLFDYMNNGRGVVYWLRPDALLPIVPVLALILGLICQFMRPHDFRSLRVFTALSLLQFWLPIVLFFGLLCGLRFGGDSGLVFSVWWLFIYFALPMCSAIIVLSVIFLVFISSPPVKNADKILGG